MFIPKKILYAVGIVAILAVGIFIGSLLQKGALSSAPLYPSKEEPNVSAQAAAVQDAPVYSYIPRNVGVSEKKQGTKNMLPRKW